MSILFQYLIALLQWQSVCGTWNILEFVQGSRLSCFLVPWKRNDIHRVNKLNNPFQINLPSDATKDPLFSNRWDELSGPKEQSCLMGSGRIPGPVSTVTNLPKTLCEIRLMGHRWTQSRAVVTTWHLAQRTLANYFFQESIKLWIETTALNHSKALIKAFDKRNTNLCYGNLCRLTVC